MLASEPHTASANKHRPLMPGRTVTLDAMSEYRSAARLWSWGEVATEAGKDLLKKAPWIGVAYAIARKYMP